MACLTALFLWCVLDIGAYFHSPSVEFVIPLIFVLLSLFCFAICAAGSTNRKRSAFLLAGIALTAAAIIFVWYALWHPETSIPLSLSVICALYLIYLAITILCFVAAIVVKK